MVKIWKSRPADRTTVAETAAGTWFVPYLIQAPKTRFATRHSRPAVVTRLVTYGLRLWRFRSHGVVQLSIIA